MNENKNKKALTDEQLKKVAGGLGNGGGTLVMPDGEVIRFGCVLGPCPECGANLVCTDNLTTQMHTDIYCEYCRHTEPDRPM